MKRYAVQIFARRAGTIAPSDLARGAIVFNFGEEEIKRLFMNCLMVAGGYVAGYVLGMLAAIGFDKLVTHRQSPDGLHKVVRTLCGLIAAILVALLVFRGGGGGNGTGTGPGNDSGQTAPSGANVPDPNKTSTELPRTDSKVTVETVRVKVLAGDEVEKGTSRFYIVADSATRVERAAVLDAVTERKKAAKGTVVVVYEFGREAGPNTIAFAELAADIKRLGVQLMSDDEFRQFVNKK
jgi:hypothetical protein